MSRLRQFRPWIFSVLFLLTVVVSSCASSGSTDSRSSQSVDTDPCYDSLYLALQNKPASQLTAYEQAYFNEKYNECHGISYNSSNGAEVMTAIILTVAAIIALFIPR
jgi:hypothetical protein